MIQLQNRDSLYRHSRTPAPTLDSGFHPKQEIALTALRKHCRFRNGRCSSSCSNVASLLKPYQPLQNRDLDRILKFVQGKANLLLNGHSCDTYEHLAQYSSRIEEWVQDDIGEVDVSGTKLKDYPRYQAKNYQLGYDIHGLLVPREYEDEACRRKRQRKRRREEHSETTEEEGMQISEDAAPDQKRTKAHPASMYPSPPVSSPQESVLSSPPPSSTDSDFDSQLDEESSSDGSSGTYPEEFGNSQSVEENSSNVEQNRRPVPLHVDTYPPARFGMPSPTYSRPQQDFLIRAPSPSCGRPESATCTLPQPTVLSPSAQFELLPQSASFDLNAPAGNPGCGTPSHAPEDVFLCNHSQDSTADAPELEPFLLWPKNADLRSQGSYSFPTVFELVPSSDDETAGLDIDLTAYRFKKNEAENQKQRPLEPQDLVPIERLNSIHQFTASLSIKLPQDGKAATVYVFAKLELTNVRLGMVFRSDGCKVDQLEKMRFEEVWKVDGWEPGWIQILHSRIPCNTRRHALYLWPAHRMRKTCRFRERENDGNQIGRKLHILRHPRRGG